MGMSPFTSILSYITGNSHHVLQQFCPSPMTKISVKMPNNII